MILRVALLASVFTLAACRGSTAPASAPHHTPASTQELPDSGSMPASAEASASDASSNGRPALTSEECKKQGGHVVGDIGDGATLRPGYRCPDSDAPPIGSIQFEPRSPMPIEGAVCCPTVIR